MFLYDDKYYEKIKQYVMVDFQENYLYVFKIFNSITYVVICSLILGN